MGEHLQKNKRLVWEFWQAMNGQNATNAGQLMAHYIAEDAVLHAMHPVNTLTGRTAIHAQFWEPFLHSFPDITRETHIFFAGEFRDQDWICGTGYFHGTFTHDWLGIPAHGQQIHLRFGEYARVQDEKIVETYLIIDLLEVLLQIGYRLIPVSSGDEALKPPPATADGVLLDKPAASISQKTFDLVYTMLFAGLNNFDQTDKKSMGMAQYWKPDMVWYGPMGIGTTYGLKGFEDHHQLPFLHAFPDRKATEQDVLIAEGNYAGASGFPGVIAHQTGEYLGHPPTGNFINMRVMDWWRREGDYLVENWVLIDIIDIFKQFGVDLLQQFAAQLKDQSTKD